MKLLAISFFVVLLCFSATLRTGTENAPNAVLSAEQQDEMIIVRVDGKTFTCYRFGDGQKYPYFYPVNGPVSGISLTTESSLPYPHHRSLFFGCDKVNGGNYWQDVNERGQIISHGPKIISGGPECVHILDECVWRQPGKAPIITDRRDIVITAPSDSLRIIDFSITISALTDITIERTNHSLFSARMKPSLSVKEGGVLINAEGDAGEKGTWGKNSSWCDYYGKHCGVVEGLAIFDSPHNLWYPDKWFTRDYGFFSPTSMYWLDDDGFSLKKSEMLDLQYRVVVHAGDAKESAIHNLFLDWAEKPKR